MLCCFCIHIGAYILSPSMRGKGVRGQGGKEKKKTGKGIRGQGGKGIKL